LTACLEEPRLGDKFAFETAVQTAIVEP